MNLKQYKHKSSNSYIWIHGFMGLFKLWMSFKLILSWMFQNFESWSLGEKKKTNKPLTFLQCFILEYWRNLANRMLGGLGSEIFPKYKNTECKCLSFQEKLTPNQHLVEAWSSSGNDKIIDHCDLFSKYSILKKTFFLLFLLQKGTTMLSIISDYTEKRS